MNRPTESSADARTDDDTHIFGKRVEHSKIEETILTSVLLWLCHPRMQRFLDNIDGLTDCCFLLLPVFGRGNDLVLYSEENFEDGDVLSNVIKVHISCILTIWSKFRDRFSNKVF